MQATFARQAPSAPRNGISRKFDVRGTISTIKHGEYITMLFDISEDAADAVRKMNDAGSGMVNGEKPTIRRLEGGNLIDRPHPPLEVRTVFEENRLVLDFEPGKRGYVVSDGFEGKGHVEAEIVSAP